MTAPKAIVNPVKYKMTISTLLPLCQLVIIPIKEAIEKTTFNQQRAVTSDLSFLFDFIVSSINRFKMHRC